MPFSLFFFPFFISFLFLLFFFSGGKINLFIRKCPIGQYFHCFTSMFWLTKKFWKNQNYCIKLSKKLRKWCNSCLIWSTLTSSLNGLTIFNFPPKSVMHYFNWIIPVMTMARSKIILVSQNVNASALFHLQTNTCTICLACEGPGDLGSACGRSQWNS